MDTQFPDLDYVLASNREKRAKKKRRQASNEYRREYYAQHRERHLEYTKSSRKRRSRALKEIVDAFKAQPCAACGGSFPAAAMQCHHRDPATKAAPVATLVHRAVREETLRLELAKCDAICANCHMIMHYGGAE